MITADARHALETRFGERARFDVPMSRHTSLRIGGPADALVTPIDRAELCDLLRLCAEHELPRTLLGAGFNLLIRDAGLAGVVVCLKKLRALSQRPGPSVYAEAGVSHASVTRFCVERGLTGLEFGAGIPGTVGGWIAMNAGIGIREQKDVVREIEIVTADGEESIRLGRDVLDFRYRELVGLPDGAVVVAALFDVDQSTTETVREEVERLLAQRHATQPLDVPSCGSVFRNPEGDYAGRLIERAGLSGERIGGAQISPVHANFIVNLGGASADDVLALIELARERIRKTDGIELETEVRILGRST
jgi:UDP-N-acetylmuramate dehydrogenase